MLEDLWAHLLGHAGQPLSDLSLSCWWQTLRSGGEMSWMGFLCHPVWAVSTALLAVVVRLQRRGRWDPQASDVQLKGKTAIVTGANTGRAH